jgi:PiT family inorganic phosphate transporter
VTALLLALALAFAWSMGAHYTGACMGMPHALGAISARRALVLMAPLTLLGAAFASRDVVRRVGHGFTSAPLGTRQQAAVVAAAFAATAVFNRVRVPTSTIQIFVFALVGVALAGGDGVRWRAIGSLAVVWISAPLAAVAVGYALTRLLDAVLPAQARIGGGLVLVGAAASFAMGANDVANAAGPLAGAGVLSAFAAGAVGGAGLAAGVLLSGRPLLTRVAFEIVAVDRPMAAAAQLVQAAVVLAAVAFGYFTSMNQALVGAMAGAGLARGRETVCRATLLGILRGWLLGPALGLGAGYALGLLA